MANNKFERLEYKYLITKQQQKKLLEKFPNKIKVDAYGKTDIFNLYFDTQDYRLIRSSIEKPVYKEKLRIRSYGRAAENDPVFIELKKKYKGIVYKRRIEVPFNEAMASLATKKTNWANQIGKEIDYVVDHYQSLMPRMFIGYSRIAYYDQGDSDFRVTFDENIKYRLDDLTLNCHNEGALLIDEQHVLMEIKIIGAFPLWLANALSDLKISKSSFSKYGNAYKTCLKRGLIEIEPKTNYKHRGGGSYA